MKEPNVTDASGTPIRVRSVVGFLIFIELASGFIQGFYPPLLKEFATHLGVTDSDITWFITLQTLAAAVSVPLLSKLGDVFGHRKILRIAILSVFVGTLMTALVPNYTLVLVGRVLVGPLAVWLPLEVAIVHNRITGESARKAIGLLVSFLTGGAIVGAIAAGVISKIAPSISVTMLAPSVLVAVAIYAVYFKVPESTNRTHSTIDYVGFAGIAIFMVTLLYGLRVAGTAGITSPTALIPLGIGLVVFVLWVMWELKVDSPAIDVRLTASKRVGPIYLAGLFFGMVLFGGQSPLTTYMASSPAVEGYGFDATPGLLAAVNGSVTILTTVGAAVFSFLAAKIGIRTVLVGGAALAAIGNFMLIPLHASLPGFFAGQIVQGIGFGLMLGALPARLAELAPSDSTGIATGVYNSLRTLGGALAGAIFAAMLGAATASGQTYSSLGGYLTIWTFAGVILAIGAVGLLFLPGDSSDADSPTTVSTSK